MPGQFKIHIKKSFGHSFTLFAKIQILLEDSHIQAIVGPSGSGKTTLARCIAGLERPDEGVIHFQNETWFSSINKVNLSPQRRKLGYTSQQDTLFPHLSVRENMMYGLRQISKSLAEERVNRLIDLLSLGGLTARFPSQLSAGQKQRVALARTVSAMPRFLLLDEPWSALDESARKDIRFKLKPILAEFNIATVLITHDWNDVLALANRVLVLNQGLVQFEAPVSGSMSFPEFI